MDGVISHYTIADSLPTAWRELDFFLHSRNDEGEDIFFRNGHEHLQCTSEEVSGKMTRGLIRATKIRIAPRVGWTIWLTPQGTVYYAPSQEPLSVMGFILDKVPQTNADYYIVNRLANELNEEFPKSTLLFDIVELQTISSRLKQLESRSQQDVTVRQRRFLFNEIPSATREFFMDFLQRFWKS